MKDRVSKNCKKAVAVLTVTLHLMANGGYQAYGMKIAEDGEVTTGSGSWIDWPSVFPDPPAEDATSQPDNDTGDLPPPPPPPPEPSTESSSEVTNLGNAGSDSEGDFRQFIRTQRGDDTLSTGEELQTTLRRSNDRVGFDTPALTAPTLSATSNGPDPNQELLLAAANSGPSAMTPWGVRATRSFDGSDRDYADFDKTEADSNFRLNIRGLDFTGMPIDGYTPEGDPAPDSSYPRNDDPEGTDPSRGLTTREILIGASAGGEAVAQGGYYLSGGRWFSNLRFGSTNIANPAGNYWMYDGGVVVGALIGGFIGNRIEPGWLGTTLGAAQGAVGGYIGCGIGAALAGPLGCFVGAAILGAIGGVIGGLQAKAIKGIGKAVKGIGKLFGFGKKKKKNNPPAVNVPVAGTAGFGDGNGEDSGEKYAEDI
ncbi:MAG: YIP1 family protein [Elusimicrobia bacterium]|nr:YIP1 family protein [Elusimicrobiota bacterium]